MPSEFIEKDKIININLENIELPPIDFDFNTIYIIEPNNNDIILINHVIAQNNLNMPFYYIMNDLGGGQFINYLSLLNNNFNICNKYNISHICFILKLFILPTFYAKNILLQNTIYKMFFFTSGIFLILDYIQNLEYYIKNTNVNNNKLRKVSEIIEYYLKKKSINISKIHIYGVIIQIIYIYINIKAISFSLIIDLTYNIIARMSIFEFGFGMIKKIGYIFKK